MKSHLIIYPTGSKNFGVIMNEKGNKFIIVVPFYNVEKWVKKCIKSIIFQDYENYECYLVDDISTDNSYEIAENLILNDKRFHLIKNETKKFALKNIYEAIQLSGNSPEDVIVTLDGDDFFATKTVLSKLNNIYKDYNCLMTYGSYIEYPSMQKGNFCKQIASSTIKDNSYRENPWVSSHLRTFKRSLWDQIEISDLKDDKGEFYRMTWDLAFMFPMLEMAGPLAMHIPEILYVYNRENPNNDDKINHQLQLQTEQKIRNKKRYIREFVTCNILGPAAANSGLGNQLFCIANTLSYAKDTGKIPFFPQIQSDEQIRKYKNLFYSNLNFGVETEIYHNSYKEKSFKFNKIPNFEGNLRIDGYYQSENYFIHNRNHIIESLNIDNLKRKLKNKYSNFNFENLSSIHIRRGDYLKLQDYHFLLDLEYYKKAISYLGQNNKYLIFSDDIEWCKKNLTFINNPLYMANEDWEDLLIMSMCKNNIIANSTFSWWSAWLNENKDKEIIAPVKWFADSNPLETGDLYPDDWRIL